jgi:hypothetical protein
MRRINVQQNFTWDHIAQFVDLWSLVRNVQLHVDTEEVIA